MYILIFMLIHGASAEAPVKLVGCENTPCDQQCVDTVDSYYCLCFENYVMQPDQHSCLHKNTEALEMAFQGCFEEHDSNRDVPYKIWSRPEDATVPECMHDCNARRFDFAAMQGGTECWCGNTYERAYEESNNCNIPCPGSAAQICGGPSANSIYKINRDERYMGCFTEDSTNPDLPTILWPETEGNSIDECITSCGAQGFNYSGVFNGGQCSCGNSYGKHGSPGDDYCNVPCYDGYAGFNCGGNTTNAVYRVSKGTSFAGAMSRGALKIEGSRAELNLDQLFLYPNYMGLYTDRVLIYASDLVNTVYEDKSCTSGECYNLCGEIFTPPGLDKFKKDVIIRRFHLNLTEVEALVSFPEEAERVHVFAQTFVIDKSVVFPWSLKIRARQIIIDYENNPQLDFDHLGPVFPESIEDALIYGSTSDLTFQKLSLLCAQILVSSTEDTNNRVGWNILDDMARDRAYNKEQQHFLDNVRAVRAALSSIGRNDMHWAPFYGKNYYMETLDAFYREINEYNEVFEEMLDEAMACQDFIDRAGTLIGIWTDTVVEQARIIKDYFKDNVLISKSVTAGIILEMQESVAELEIAKDKFKEGIKKAIIVTIVRVAMNGLIKVIDRMVNGKFKAGAKENQRDIREASEGAVSIDRYDTVVEHLTKANEQMFLFNDVSDDLTETEDFERYNDNVEIVAGLENLLPLWTELKTLVNEIFSFDIFRNIDGALDFSFALFDLLNWFEYLNRTLLEFAYNIRNWMAVTAVWLSKVEMQIRFELYFTQLQADCNLQQRMAINFAEQNYDVMLELNQQLIQFCQSYYYEEMWECPAEAMPNFAYTVQELLTTINQAKLLSQYTGRRSTAKLDVIITDNPEAWSNCTDSRMCPVKMLRDTRTLNYELPIDHPRFQGLDLFLIEEMEVYFPGATSTNAYTDLRMEITSSGPFYQKRGDVVNTFVSRPIPGMMFQYDIVTDAIQLYLNFYNTGDGTIRQMSPFATWVVKVPASHDYIDLSEVTSVRIVFSGSTYN